jgi:hypothetical protein
MLTGQGAMIGSEDKLRTQDTRENDNVEQDHNGAGTHDGFHHRSTGFYWNVLCAVRDANEVPGEQLPKLSRHFSGVM